MNGGGFIETASLFCEPFAADAIRLGYAIYEGIPVGMGFNPLLFGIMVAVDIGIAIENSVRKNLVAISAYDTW